MSRKITRRTKHFLITEKLDENWKSYKVKAKDLTRHFSSVWIGVPLRLKTGEEYEGLCWSVKRIN